MKERPILFSAPMVRAIREGRKTQTRRAVKLPPAPMSLGDWEPGTISADPAENSTGVAIPKQGFIGHTRTGKSLMCPHGQPGDRLWVRETWSGVNLLGAPALAYKATGDVVDLMDDASFLDADGAFNYDDPRAQMVSFDTWSADLIDGTEGRWRPSIHMPRWVSRILLEITDVRVERLQSISEGDCCAEGVGSPITRDYKKPKFQALWESINGTESWAADPWVWALTFKVVR